MKYEIENRLPTLTEYRQLCEAVGWGDVMNFEVIEAALENSVTGFIARLENGPVIAMGRIVGDGVIYFYIQDVVVAPDYQNQQHYPSHSHPYRYLYDTGRVIKPYSRIRRTALHRSCSLLRCGGLCGCAAGLEYEQPIYNKYFMRDSPFCYVGHSGGAPITSHP